MLQGFPQEIIQRACIKYQQMEPRRKPTPALVYAICKKLMPVPERAHVPPEPRPDKPKISKKKRLEILKEKGYRVNEDGWVAPPIKKMETKI